MNITPYQFAKMKLKPRGKAQQSESMTKRQLLGGYRSKLEVEYAEHLYRLKMFGVIKSYVYEIDKIYYTPTLVRPACYTPDFTVLMADGTLEFHETKGYMWAKDKIRYRCVQDFLNRQSIKIQIYVITKEGGTWKKDAVK